MQCNLEVQRSVPASDHKQKKKQQARFHVDHEFTEMSRTVQEFENLVLDAAIMYILNSGNIKAICTIKFGF